ncbi:PD40 domain-containing protein [Actinosynnema pretiosum subsp. pretiosum]|uniref:WD40 domain protein beta Propeller n=2 Tax=Actinosynnema TaxID=40566 RepID=C6WRL0_ACTMD|nr:DUF11 domain-containing protein [Actinosynnema mirum]ACU36852.1 WD40 domain protein beta Propeller [Actinosynnema mirum DSM 43827]QUF05523.1 PD40 domain-containing protein [Actinosynnema pretiosum subsp. pretiosum]
MFTRFRAVVVAVVAVLLGGVVVVLHSGVAPAQQDDPPPPQRIAYAGTEHRGIGQFPAPQNGYPTNAPSPPLLPDRPAHFDDEVSARGGLVVFVSMRAEKLPQVFLRQRDGSVVQLTEGMYACHPQLTPDLGTVVFQQVRGDGSGELWAVDVDGTNLRRITPEGADPEEWPTISPDGLRVAFSAGGQIRSRPLAGGPSTQLTDEPGGGAGEPVWHPTEDRIVYKVGAGRARLRVLEDGASRDFFAENQAGWNGRWPVWMPDGQGLLFISCGCLEEDPREGVYRVAGDGGEPVGAAPQLLLREDRQVSAPAWIGDPLTGTLLIARTTASVRNEVRLQDIQPDGTDPRDLGIALALEHPDIASDSRLLFKPTGGYDPWTLRQTYSPDGRKIVYTAFEGPLGSRLQRIWTANADGSDPVRLNVSDRLPTDWEFDPAWSPNGEQIAITRRSPGGIRPDNGPSRIAVVDASTGQVLRELVAPPGAEDQEDTQPAWSPDGRTLSFTRGVVFDDETGTEVRDNHIWTADAATLGNQRDISEIVCGAASPCEVTDDSSVFSPDSGDLVFNREQDALISFDLDRETCRVLVPQGSTQCGAPVVNGSGPFQPRDAAFSPEGGRLVVSTRRGAASEQPETLALVDFVDGGLSESRVNYALPGRQKEPSWRITVDLAVRAPSSTPEVTTGRGVEIPVVVANNGPGVSSTTTLTVVPPEGVRVDELRTPQGTCDVAELACQLGVLQPDQEVTVVVVVTGVTAGRREIAWGVAGGVVDPEVADNSARTVVPVVDAQTSTTAPPTTTVPPATTTPPSSPPPPPPPPPPAPPQAGPALAVAVRPNPSYVGGRASVVYTVRNGGGANATGLRLELALPRGIPVAALPPGCSATACALRDLPPGGTQALTVVLAPVAPGQGTARGVVRTTGSDDNAADNAATAQLRVLLPRIVAVPPIGEPGFVTSVRGLDFPPGVPVRLTWKPGITATAAPTLPRPDGSFIAQLLILPKDQTGPRVITASGDGFRPATTPFLVVPGTIGPPDMVNRR